MAFLFAFCLLDVGLVVLLVVLFSVCGYLGAVVGLGGSVPCSLDFLGPVSWLAFGVSDGSWWQLLTFGLHALG